MSKVGVLVWRKIFESGDARRLAKQKQDLSDLSITRDIPYIDDGDQGHLLDIYRLPDAPANAPVVINIHGGGLFASYKEVNANFNYEWARMGYVVASISYRRIPETTLWNQVNDVMAALRHLAAHATDLGLSLDRCYLTGDSAGALLALFALALESSPDLRKAFDIDPCGLHFQAAGLISIMLDTQRTDLMRAINSVILGSGERGGAYARYLLDPALLLDHAKLPPLFLATSEEDLIRNDTLKFDRALTASSAEHTLLDFPRGKERKLVHVFSVAYPAYPESRTIFSEMDAFFKACKEA